VRPHGRRRGRHQGGEGRWEARRALSSRPFCPFDGRWGSPGYLSAGLRYTTNRKVSAVINYFLWLTSLQALPKDPTAPLANARIQSPLPDYLYEQEIKTLYHEASQDPRLYLLVLLFLETGMKSSELSSLTDNSMIPKRF
jgi:integrase